jgi:hypothetical protein
VFIIKKAHVMITKVLGIEIPKLKSFDTSSALLFIAFRSLCSIQYDDKPSRKIMDDNLYLLRCVLVNQFQETDVTDIFDALITPKTRAKIALKDACTCLSDMFTVVRQSVQEVACVLLNLHHGTADFDKVKKFIEECENTALKFIEEREK